MASRLQSILIAVVAGVLAAVCFMNPDIDFLVLHFIPLDGYIFGAICAAIAVLNLFDAVFRKR